jgi:hypothetical protein
MFIKAFWPLGGCGLDMMMMEFGMKGNWSLEFALKSCGESA